MLPHVDGAELDNVERVQFRGGQSVDTVVVQPDTRSGLPSLGVCQLGCGLVLVSDL
jgi:hypothetical protein